jgi:hemerythrin
MTTPTNDGGDRKGSPGLREQHFRIARLLEELEWTVSHGAEAVALEPIFVELVAYTQIHFRAEEREFRIHGYPQAAQHEREHLLLTRSAFSLRDEFRSGRPFATASALTFIETWRTHHFGGPDEAYARFLAGDHHR